MKSLLALVLGISAASGLACKSDSHSEMEERQIVTLAVSGMT